METIKSKSASEFFKPKHGFFSYIGCLDVAKPKKKYFLPKLEKPPKFLSSVSKKDFKPIGKIKQKYIPYP